MVSSLQQCSYEAYINFSNNFELPYERLNLKLDPVEKSTLQRIYPKMHTL